MAWSTPVTTSVLANDSKFEAMAVSSAVLVLEPNPREIAQLILSIASEVGEVDDLDWQVLGGSRIIEDGALLSSQAVTAKTFVDGDVDTGDDHVTFGAIHELHTTGDGPFTLTSSGTLPAGLALATNYWIIVQSTVNIQFAASEVLALAGTPVTISGAAGGGTHTLNQPGSHQLSIAAADSQADDYYMGMYFAMTSGGEAAELRTVVNYDKAGGAAADLITLDYCLSGAPSAAETYDIFHMGLIEEGTIIAETDLTQDISQNALIAVSGYPALIIRTRSTGGTDAHLSLMTYALDGVSA